MHLRIIILEDTPSEFMQTKHALEQYADLSRRVDILITLAV